MKSRLEEGLAGTCRHFPTDRNGCTAEVDRTELWSKETPMPRIDLPPDTESFILPSKALLIQVVAFDAAGGKVAESETVRFRLLQNVHTH